MNKPALSPNDPSRLPAQARRGVATLAVLALLGSIEPGCDRAGPAPAPPAASLPAVDQSTPQAAAESLLRSFQNERAARRAGDRAAAAHARALSIELAATDRIQAEIAKRPEYAIVLDHRSPAEFVDRWGAMIAYYVDGADFAAASVAGAGDAVAVRIPAAGAGASTTLKLTCVRAANGWAVSRIAFEKPAPPSAPAVP